MKFIESRGNEAGFEKEVEFSYAILNPSASFGGLYVPKELPKLDESFFSTKLEYKDLAKKIIELFGIDIESSVVGSALALYEKFDDSTNPAPLVKVKSDLFVNELYHGPTRAFKDMALQPFGYILSHLAKRLDKKYLILAATSGDTGPATLESFKNKPNIQVVCLYPDGGTSDVQRLQMVTEDGKNLKVLGIKGDFDDAQNALKTLLASDNFKENLEKNSISLSAANSVNFGRILFQIIYHIHSYNQLLKSGKISYGDKIYITIPSGNFGNALGAYYAKRMGLPIEKILITSNANNVLKELIREGRYDLREKALQKTYSPAMDILKSSNVERVLFDLFGAKRTKELMESLNSNNFYELTGDELAKIREIFDAVYSSDEYALKTIKEYANSGYVMDPHTATCIKAYEELKTKEIPMVICSTAEWTKFAPTMVKAIEPSTKTINDKEALEFIKDRLKLDVTQKISSLFNKEIIHDEIINKDDIEKNIIKFIS